jgi:hypothetical protein
MSQTEPAGVQPGSSGNPGLATLPAIWVGVVVLMSIYGIYRTWPAIHSYDIPDSALYLIYTGLTASAVNILWGLYLLGLAISRSSTFPRHFIIWQIANIGWIALREAYVLVMPDFMLSLTPLLFAVGEIAIGVFCIRLLGNQAATASAYSNSGTERPPVIVSIIAALLGIIVGGALGAVIGFGGGVLYADATNMSGFEGASGYFAAFIGLLGMVAGAIGGAILAVWLVNRRRPARAA